MALYEKSEPSTPDPGPSTSGIQHAAQAEAEEKAVCQHGAKATDKTPGQDKKVRGPALSILSSSSALSPPLGSCPSLA